MAGQQKKPKKRHQFSIEFKVNALNKWRELNNNVSKAARDPSVSVDRQTLAGWIKLEEKLRAQVNKREKKRLKPNRHHLVKYQTLEADLVDFIRSERDAKRSVSYRRIIVS
ncbi:MAG: hypothetical protein GY795_19030 [Desulfobacterales bacterium]|nr:hypothetical protein [Desulfobacterales bacterium]